MPPGASRKARPGTWRSSGWTSAGPDEKYDTAQAEIFGNTVVVTSSKVAAAAGVRYGFYSNAAPCFDLLNQEGLPAAAFGADGVTLPLTVSAGPGGSVSPGNTVIVARRRRSRSAPHPRRTRCSRAGPS